MRARTPVDADPTLLTDALLSSPHLSFYVRDAEGRYLTVSEGYCRLMGLRREDILGRRAAEFLPAHLATAVDEVNRKIVESGEPTAGLESHVIDGSQRDFEVHRVPIRDREGRVVGVLGIATEETERLRLLRETQFLNQVLTLLSQATSLQSCAEGLLDCLTAETGCRVAGIRALDARGESRPGVAGGRAAAPFVAHRGVPEAILAEARRQDFLTSECPCAAVMRGDAAALVPARLDDLGCLVIDDLVALHDASAGPAPLCDWGSLGLRTLAIFPIRYQGEALGCVLLGDPEPGRLSPVARNLVHRVLPLLSQAVARFEAERQVEASRSRLQSVVHSIPLPVWIVDRRYRVVFRNEAHEREFGPATEGMACYQVRLGRREPCPDCDFPETLMKATTRREWRDPRTDRTYDVIAVPYDSISGERQRMEVFFDVTDRVRTQEQLRQTQRLDSLGSLAAGIAHDFNNILAGIIGYCQLGLQRCDRDSEHAAIFQQVGQIAERGTELTRKVLAFSRRQPLKVTTLDINGLITDMRTMIRPLAGDRVEVVLDLAERLWAVQGDASQIEQVLLNLCVNAVEAMPGGGRLTIRTRNVEGEALRKALAQPPGRPGEHQPPREVSHGVLIEVSDTGHGMTREVAAQAVEPFFTTKGRGRGTGLGLSVSYGIVQQHHGNLQIESTLGVGTTVRVCLPSMSVTPSSAPRPKPVHDQMPHAALSRYGPALVVEDDLFIRDLVAALLREARVEVRTAAGGAEALEVLSSEEGQATRLIITDVAMPGMSGLELARRVRAMRPDISVLFMSGCSDATLEQYGLTEEHLLLRKPFTLEELVRGIEAAVSPPG